MYFHTLVTQSEKEKWSRSVVSNSLSMDSPGSSIHGNFPGKNTGVGCHFLLQGIFSLPELDIKPASPALAGGFFTTKPHGKLSQVILWLNSENNMLFRYHLSSDRTLCWNHLKELYTLPVTDVSLLLSLYHEGRPQCCRKKRVCVYPYGGKMFWNS